MEHSGDAGGMHSSDVSRARAATFMAFFVTGAVFATWAARVPAVQDRLGLSSGGLALAVLGLEGGAVLGLPAGGMLVARAGSRWTLRLGFAVYPPALLGAALATSLAWLTAMLALMAGANSLIDVAMNAQGVELERRCRRPLLSSLHAGHSLGVLAGAVAGTIAAASGLALTTHFACAAALGLLAGQAAARRLLLEPRRPPQAALVRPTRSFVLLGLVAFCAFLIDATASTWSAVHLRSERDAGPALAAGAFTAFALTLALARLVTDRLVARTGRTRFVQLAAPAAAAGAAVALVAPAPLLAVAGWGLLGAAVGGIAPTVLGAAPAMSTASPAVAIAAVTTLGYLGSFSGPPLVGALAELTDLTLALGVLVLAAVLACVLARPALRSPASA
jgi:MFS family permease